LFEAQLERMKQDHQGMLDLVKARLDADIALAAADHSAALSETAAADAADRVETKADLDADRAADAAFNQAVAEVAKGAIDRARAGADFVQKAASAVFALYTGALALAFSVGDHPLPLRGILPSIFLGLAIALSSGYLAYLTDASSVSDPQPVEGTAQAQLERTRTFIAWVHASVVNRSVFLRAAVMALGVGVFVLPAPFLTLPATTVSAPSNCRVGLELDASSGGCLPPWPSIPTGSKDDVTLRLNLLAAQTTEISAARASARREAAASVDDTQVTLEVIGVGLAIIVLGALLADRKLSSEKVARGGRSGWLMGLSAVIRMPFSR
jgi:hypothetical protein